MGYNYCRGCGSNCGNPGSGVVRDPASKWWQFWKTIPCPHCGGDGYAKPPGWPDEKEIRRLRPAPPMIPASVIGQPSDYNYSSEKIRSHHLCGNLGKAPRDIAEGEEVTIFMPPNERPYFVTADGLRSIHDDN